MIFKYTLLSGGQLWVLRKEVFVKLADNKIIATCFLIWTYGFLVGGHIAFDAGSLVSDFLCIIF